MTRNIEEIRGEFIEKIGLMAQADGLPRIAGRMLGLFIWDGEAVAFGDLANQLQVSRGSISTATRILEDRRLIKRIAKAGQRQDYFQLAENPYAQMLEHYVLGLERVQIEIAQTLGEIPTNEADIKGRIEAYGAFYRTMSGALSKLADDLKAG
ncbi:MAG: hypothetical protein ABF243_06185 [Celeribacter marinus]